MRFFARALPPLAFVVICFALAGCGHSNGRSVVIYTSQDEVYAEPIFKDFEKQTGIEVRAVYDSEAVKTVGLVQRLLNEASHPQCDVFWNNEEMRTRLLVAKNLFRETNGWALLGYRSRRLVVNTNLLPLAKAPQSFRDATNEVWRGKFALAYPLFGTTSTHFLALRQHWGDAPWQSWCRTLAANKPLIVDGNSVVVKLVGSGEAWFGFTDSDDVASEQREGLPIAAVPLSEDGLILHNTAGAVRDSPHPAEAQQLFEYLKSAAVQEQLVRMKALESPLPADGKSGAGLKVDWESLLHDLDAATEESRQIFLR
ncbi:MAG: Extracellular solute-binding protein family 1 [Pedosphaera sp.]|nr:Extracellular solute-binding protein family 1 [Pedosphaera sp.]